MSLPPDSLADSPSPGATPVPVPPEWAIDRVPDYGWRDLAAVGERFRAPLHRRWLIGGECPGGVAVELGTAGSGEVRVGLHGPHATDEALLAELRTVLHALAPRSIAAEELRQVEAPGGPYLTLRAVVEPAVSVTIRRWLRSDGPARVFDWAAK